MPQGVKVQVLFRAPSSFFQNAVFFVSIALIGVFMILRATKTVTGLLSQILCNCSALPIVMYHFLQNFQLLSKII